MSNSLDLDQADSISGLIRILTVFACCLSSADFFENLFQEYHESVKQFGSRLDSTSYDVLSSLIWVQTVLHAFLSSADCFSKSTFSKISILITIRVSNRLDPDQARCFVGPDLGPHCLQRSSADDISRQIFNYCWQPLSSSKHNSIALLVFSHSAVPHTSR